MQCILKKPYFLSNSQILTSILLRFDNAMKIKNSKDFVYIYIYIVYIPIWTEIPQKLNIISFDCESNLIISKPTAWKMTINHIIFRFDQYLDSRIGVSFMTLPGMARNAAFAPNASLD